MSFRESFSVALIFGLCFSTVSAKYSLTHLEIDNHPCKPENLKHTNRYICDSKGKVICQAGWKEPEFREQIHELNPCLEPVCNISGRGCQHGECRAPNNCACEIGWEGSVCDQCIPLPGCDHGSCNSAFQCNCEQGWTGAYCNMAKCSARPCIHGDCVAPEICGCHDGWRGKSCDQCEVRAGCKNGRCGNEPYTCECDQGWSGHLCDTPVCDPNCINGICTNIRDERTNSSSNICICRPGWKGPQCSECVAYWNCPNNNTFNCIVPNECICPPGFPAASDPQNLCNSKILTTLSVSPDSHVSFFSGGEADLILDHDMPTLDGVVQSDPVVPDLPAELPVFAGDQAEILELLPPVEGQK